MGIGSERLLTKYERVIAGERPPKELIDYERETMRKQREQEKVNQSTNNPDQKAEDKNSS